MVLYVGSKKLWADGRGTVRKMVGQDQSVHRTDQADPCFGGAVSSAYVRVESFQLFKGGHYLGFVNFAAYRTRRFPGRSIDTTGRSGENQSRRHSARTQSAHRAGQTDPCFGGAVSSAYVRVESFQLFEAIEKES